MTSFSLHYHSNSLRVLAYEFVRGNTRTIDFAWTVGTILLNYKYSFRNIDEDTPEYDEVSHCVNKYAAEKLLRLFKYISVVLFICRRLGGYYMKIGQMASTMETGLPIEWKETLSQCQVCTVSIPWALGQSNSCFLFQRITSTWRRLGSENIRFVHWNRWSTGRMCFISAGSSWSSSFGRGSCYQNSIPFNQEVYPNWFSKYQSMWFLYNRITLQLAMRVIKRFFPSFGFAVR